MIANGGTHGGRTPIVLALLCLASMAGFAAPTPAFAQQVILIVNGEVITDYDIEQRTKFVFLSTHKTPTRAEVIEDLIDDKLKVQVGRKYKVEIPDKDIDQSYADMAKRMHISAEQLTQALAQGGVAPTLKARIRSDLTWTVIVRGKFQSSLEVNEKSVLAAMETNTKKDEGEAVGYDYTLRPILFVVPHGNNEIAELRRKDAEVLRARFMGCDTGLPYARSFRDVTVREFDHEELFRPDPGVAGASRQDRGRASHPAGDDRSRCRIVRDLREEADESRDA